MNKNTFIFCEQCGTRLEAGENFCPSCGAKVNRDESPPQPPQPAQPAPTTSDNNSNNLTKFGVAVLMVLILIGSSIYHYQKSQEKTSWTYTPPETSAPADTKPKTPAAFNESDLKIGNVALNMTKSYVDEKFGAGRVQSDGWYDYGDFWAKFDSEGRVSYLSCMSGNLNTPRGIHVGSTLTEIEAAYDTNQFRKETTDETVNYECDLRSMTLIFSVLKSSNKVDKIVLVKKVQESKPPVEKSKTPAAFNESDFSIKGLTLGMNKREIEQKLGTPLIEGEDYFNYGNVEISFDNQGAKIIACTDISNTPRGIHVGSTLTEVETAYGRDYSIDKDDSGLIYTYKTEKTHLRFVVDERTRKVIRIAFYRAKTNSQPAEKPKPPAEKPKTSSSNEYNYSCTVDGEKTYRGISRRGLGCALYSVDYQKRITSNFGEKHTARGTFYIVTVIVSNRTSEPIFVPGIYLIDERGRKFSSDIDAESTWEIMYGIESAYQLNPDQSGWVYKVFDIPDNATITNLRCEASFSLEENEFNIPFRVVTD